MAWVMSTLGFGVILQSIGLAIWGPKPVVVPGPLGDDVIRLFGIGVRPQELLMLARRDRDHARLRPRDAPHDARQGDAGGGRATATSRA